MAKKRMFSLEIVGTDAFVELPIETQLLYFHLGMRADDDGFVSNPKQIIRMLKLSEDNYKTLIDKRFLIIFESGICVIKHWKISNWIAKDRYSKTKYIDELNLLKIKTNGAYTINIPKIDIEERREEERREQEKKIESDRRKNNRRKERKNYSEKQLIQKGYKQYRKFVYLLPENYNDLLEKYTELIVETAITGLNEYKKTNEEGYRTDDYYRIENWAISSAIKKIQNENNWLVISEKQKKRQIELEKEKQIKKHKEEEEKEKLNHEDKDLEDYYENLPKLEKEKIEKKIKEELLANEYNSKFPKFTRLFVISQHQNKKL